MYQQQRFALAFVQIVVAMAVDPQLMRLERIQAAPIVFTRHADTRNNPNRVKNEWPGQGLPVGSRGRV